VLSALRSSDVIDGTRVDDDVGGQNKMEIGLGATPVGGCHWFEGDDMPTSR
jgi:hypothetical protein